MFIRALLITGAEIYSNSSYSSWWRGVGTLYPLNCNFPYCTALRLLFLYTWPLYVTYLGGLCCICASVTRLFSLLRKQKADLSHRMYVCIWCIICEYARDICLYIYISPTHICVCVCVDIRMYKARKSEAYRHFCTYVFIRALSTVSKSL